MALRISSRVWYSRVGNRFIERITPSTSPASSRFEQAAADCLARVLVGPDAKVLDLLVRLTGSTRCTISRSDVPYDERAALQQWGQTVERR